MRRRMVATMLVLMMSVSIMGCTLHRQGGQDETKKTPNQILWQLRDHIKQVAKDVKDARDAKIITEKRYLLLRAKVEESAEYYNKLKAHYALWKELDDTYRHKITVALLFVAKDLKGDE